MNQSSTDPAADELPACSLVLKGGVTSGIVYPGAIHEISKRYRFVHLAGTSAGAIGAAAAAAAEFGRRQGRADSFAALGALPEWLGSQGRLASLFAPASAFRRVFRTLSLLGRPETFRSLRHALLACVRIAWDYPASTGLAILTAAAYFGGLSYASQLGALSFSVLLLSSMVLFLLVFFVATAATVLRDLSRVAWNGFGICRGFPDDSPRDGLERSYLSTWLHALIQSLAGLPPDARPLTFGDLWGDNGARPDIELQMYTACLSEERPYVLPNLGPGWYFAPSDLHRLFPQAVVEWMVQASASPAPDAGTTWHDRYLPLPASRDMPVVCAVRMSLSFPLLLSAVPLYRALPRSAQDPPGGEADRSDAGCGFLRYWFSDGGICSNFPIGLQDGRAAPVKMCIDLQYGDLPSVLRNRSGVALAPSDPRQEVSLRRFVAGLLATMQNWKDREVQRGRSGSRSITVRIDPGEGGLNLDMAPAAIASLASKGREAGLQLARGSN